MAFDRVFQGPPSAENAPGTHQSPAFGIDVVNSELYFSAGSGWEAIVGAGNVSGAGTTGFVPKFTAATVVGNSAIDDGITVAGKITSTKPLNVTSASASTFTGPLTVSSASASLFSGPLTVSSASESAFTGPVGTPYVLPTVIYSAAGTPLPTPTVPLTGARAVVSDATTPTYLGSYVSGGAVLAGVLCTGSDWVTG